MRVARNRAGAKTQTGRLRGELLAWYGRERRDLPWRRLEGRSPQARAWGVWLSEVMAQQTRLEVVVPYWERFLVRFPSPEALAAAPLEDVLAAWSGLGYYRRARSLWRAAAVVADRGEIPRTAAQLRELPGIGPYTAAAVASIAFGEAVAVVDGNVERLVSRWLGIGDDPRRASGRRRILAGAQSLLDPARPGDSNQAMMELGATVCRPRSPSCGACVLEASCVARREGRIEALPLPRARREVVRIQRWVGIVESVSGEVLFVRRADDAGALAGFWELPSVDLEGEQCLEEAEKRLGGRFGGRWTLGPELARIRHTITHRAMTLRIHRAQRQDEEIVAEGPEAVWWKPASADRRAIGAATRKALAAWAVDQASGASRD